MRKSDPKPGRLALRAGIAVAATAAAVLATTAMPAYATAPTLTQSAYAGPASGTITVSSNNFLLGTASPVAIFSTAACADPYAAAATGVTYTTATIAKSDDSTATVTIPTTLGLGTGGVAKLYYLCIYNGTVATTSVAKGLGTYTVIPPVTPTSATGVSGGGNVLTVNLPSTSPVLTTANSPVLFAAGSCPATYGTPSTTLTATATKVTTTQATVTVPSGVGGATGTNYTICFYAGLASAVASSTAVLAGSSATAYGVTLPSASLSSTIGPASVSGNLNNLTVTSTNANFLTGVTTPGVVVQATSTATPAPCAALYPTSPSSVATNIRKLSATKALFSMPTTATVGSGPLYNICVYSGTTAGTSKLLSSSTFTVAAVAALASISPSSGPALGNQTVTITGLNFPTTASDIKAWLGGVALTNITSVDDKTFTAVTPAHPTGAVALMITTPTGSDSLNTAYTYTNSLTVLPNTAPNTSTNVDVDVQGVGFSAYNFTNTANQNAKVYLVDGVYNATASGGNKVNGPVADCTSVLVISDNELACTMNLTATMTAAGTGVMANGYHSATATSAGTNVLTLSTGTLTAADTGKTVAETSNTDVPANTTILAVTSPTTAVLSNTLTTNATPYAVTIGYQGNAITITTGASGDNTITAAAGSFSQADIGRYPTGSGVGTNAIITAVDGAGGVATLSVANSGTVSTVTLTSGNAVPNGAYNLTIVSNAANGAAVSDPAYSQTTVSSTSTFTVAPF
jgi:hypothetical protein